MTKARDLANLIAAGNPLADGAISVAEISDLTASAAELNQLDNTADLPDIRPSLLLDFANSKTLDPRITFTRGSTATYYDGKTTAKAEENLLTYSQAIDQWDDYGVTVTADNTTAPDGTTTADKLAVTTTGTFKRRLRDLTLLSGNSYTFSFWVKGDTATSCSFYIQHGTSTSATVLEGTATLGSTGAAILDVTGLSTSAWARIAVTYSVTSSALGPVSIYPGVAISQTAGDSVFVWGAQLEQRSSATAYTPTTSSPIVKYQPVLQTSASGEARFDHDPVTGESKGLLIEEARTNLALYSADMNHSTWNKGNLTITDNIAIAPDGTLTADKVVETTTNTQHVLNQVIAVTSGTTYTMSFYAKDGGWGVIEFQFGSGGAQGAFNFSTGVATTSLGADRASMTSVGNGWYHCEVTGPANSSNTMYFYKTSASYTGDGYSGVFLWGAQLEEGSFPTSYIPTSGSTVTRAGESSEITGTNFSSWYTQGEGTLFAEVDHFYTSANDNYPRSVSLYGDDINTDIIGFFSANIPSVPYYTSSANITYNGAVQFDTGSLSSSTKITGYHKNGLAFEANNFAVTSDGLTPQTDAAGVVPYATKLAMFAAGGYQPVNSGYVKKIAFYPKRLPNNTLQAMTEA